NDTDVKILNNAVSVILCNMFPSVCLVYNYYFKYMSITHLLEIKSVTIHIQIQFLYTNILYPINILISMDQKRLLHSCYPSQWSAVDKERYLISFGSAQRNSTVDTT